MPTHPLAEVFGFPTDNFSTEAERFRKNRLCPYNNKSPNCTKSSVENPLGVCSVFGGSDIVITCPVRFRQDWIITTDAAAFFFPPDATWTSLTEVSLADRYGKSAGNIDLVLLSYDAQGRIMDYGALEVQAVYISGNIRTAFQHYMDHPAEHHAMDWRRMKNYPRPDYLSSSRKRLAPQLIFKGGILNAWTRKTAVALNRTFYQTLPKLDQVDKAEADIAWLVYDLQHDSVQNRYLLTLYETVYTRFEQALFKITRADAGEEQQFLRQLQTQLDKRLDNGDATEVLTPDPPF